jgi:hypothetical protein
MKGLDIMIGAKYNSSAVSSQQSAVSSQQSAGEVRPFFETYISKHIKGRLHYVEV